MEATTYSLDDLAILICSANIGNAEPTSESFNSWIPDDGAITTGNVGEEIDPDKSARNITKIKKQYDFIVIGMQEAAFAEGKKKKEEVDSSQLSTDAATERSSVASNNSKGRTSGKGKLARKIDKVSLVLRGLTHTQTTRAPIMRTSTSSRSILANANIFSTDVIELADKKGQYDTKNLASLCAARCPSYTLVTASMRGEMRLWVLCLKELADEVGEVHIAGENTGIGSVLANKGGIIATLTFRSTRISFLTCHLEAHEGLNHYTNRNKNLAEILGGAKPHPDYYMLDATIYSHHMFVCGDLNYRIRFDDNGLKRCGSNESGAKLDESDVENPENGSHFTHALKLVEEKNWEALNAGDELAMALKNKECLAEFQTLPCNFSPTFKVGREKGYVYNEKRTPSYTDRILWKSTDGMQGAVTPFLYEPCPDFITSDHKPIRGGFALEMNKCSSSQLPSAPPSQPNGATAPPSQNDGKQIHLLVSDIKCTNLPIMDNELVGGLSDPYILFVSSPKELLWDKAWPSTKVIKHNLNPVWKESIHLTIQKEGLSEGQYIESIDELYGHMLYLVVMDYDPTSGDDIIGAVALNIKDLCLGLNFTKSETDGEKKMSRRPSYYEKENIQQKKIVRPILRNGQEYGMLECTIMSDYFEPDATKHFIKLASGKIRKKKFRNKKDHIMSWFR